MDRAVWETVSWNFPEVHEGTCPTHPPKLLVSPTEQIRQCICFFFLIPPQIKSPDGKSIYVFI